MSLNFGNIQFRVNTKVQALSCPCCGAPLETSSKECAYCRTPLVVTSTSVHIKKPRIRNRDYDEYRAAFDDDEYRAAFDDDDIEDEDEPEDDIDVED